MYRDRTRCLEKDSMLSRLQKKPHRTSRAHSPAVRLTVAAAGIVLLGRILTRSDLAQTPAEQPAAAERQAWQQKSEQRDRAYVRLLLRRGMTEDKIANRLSLTTQFARFNPDGDLQAYITSIINDVKGGLQADKQSQSTTPTSQAAAGGVLLAAASAQSSASAPID